MYWPYLFGFASDGPVEVGGTSYNDDGDGEPLVV